MFSRRANQRALDNEASRDLVIQLIEPASPAGAGAVERAAISQLREQGAVPIYLLVQQLASQLYLDELRNGGAAVDIGFFGASLFVPEVVRTIRERNGTLWKISAAT